jgi:uncharacterized membrane protein (DUF2068 family)
VRSRSDAILRIIAVLKLVKGAALLAIAFGAHSLLRQDLAHGFRHWIDELSPSSHYLRHVLARILALDAHTLEMVELATVIYAALFLTEGIGLFLKKVWAEYLTTVITISFIPVEIYELVEHPSITKVTVIVLNIAIVIYLAWRLRRDHHWPFRR